MMLSNKDLQIIAKSLGRSAGSTAELMERVTGHRYEDAVEQFSDINDLLSRIATEQVRRLHKTA